jgi:CheY-like chemotaxis protein
MTWRRKRVLVLDNDPAFLVALERHLEDEGFDTTSTWDMQEAIALSCGGDFDLLVVGEHPPEVTSRTVLERLGARENPPRCVILDSVQRHPFQEQYFRSLGATAVIRKTRPEEVAAELRHACNDERASLRETG